MLAEKTQEDIDTEIHQRMLEKSIYNEPGKYMPRLSAKKTESAIKEIKCFFQNELSSALNIERKTSPLFVSSETGLNDNLSGFEKSVAFNLRCGINAQIVHSLAKWKRMTLHRFGYEEGTGLYADMNAIRREEDLSPIHSYFVDQWDWELVISKKERTIEMLKSTVVKIYGAIKRLEKYVSEAYPVLEASLPEEITFVTTQELENAYPDLSPKERENLICKQHKAVFLMQVGKVLTKSGNVHDARAPDYDDWELNGDILLYYDVLDMAFEISSMGIRVDSASLEKQLKHAGKEEYMQFEYHQKIAAGELPFTIGGGIGQSRLCMFMLKKLHIGEVQSSIWPKHVVALCEKFGIGLL